MPPRCSSEGAADLLTHIRLVAVSSWVVVNWLDSSTSQYWAYLSSAMPQWTWQDSVPVTQTREIIVRLREQRLTAWADLAVPQALLNGLDALSPSNRTLSKRRETDWLELPFNGSIVLATLWSARNLVAYANHEIHRQVAAARDLPLPARPSWTDIAIVLATTRQAAHDRFARRAAPTVQGWRGTDVAELFTTLLDLAVAEVTREWLTSTVRANPVSPEQFESPTNKVRAALDEQSIEMEQYWSTMAPARRTALARIAAARSVRGMTNREIGGLMAEAVCRKLSFADIAYALAVTRQAARQHWIRLDMVSVRLWLKYEVDAARRVAYEIAGSPQYSPVEQAAAEDFLYMLGETVARDTKRRYR